MLDCQILLHGYRDWVHLSVPFTLPDTSNGLLPLFVRFRVHASLNFFLLHLLQGLCERCMFRAEIEEGQQNMSSPVLR